MYFKEDVYSASSNYTYIAKVFLKGCSHLFNELFLNYFKYFVTLKAISVQTECTNKNFGS